MNGLGLRCLQACWLRDHFLLVAMSDHTTGTRNIKPEVVSKVQKMAWYASVCLIMGLFKGQVPVFARLWPVRIRVRVRFTTGAVRSAILATAGLLVCIVNAIQWLWTSLAKFKIHCFYAVQRYNNSVSPCWTGAVSVVQENRNGNDVSFQHTHSTVTHH